MNTKTTTAELTVTECIIQLLQYLGVEQAHFASRSLGDLSGLAEQHPEMLASLTLVCPSPSNMDIAGAIGSRLLVFRGDRADYDRLGQVIEALPGATLAVLRNDIAWSDLIERHTDEILSMLLPFLVRQTPAALPYPTVRDGKRGEVAGISYFIQSSGPRLVLMPLGLIPSQWDPIASVLAEKYCTITLGGAELGMVSLLEKRATTAGYLAMINALVQAAQLQSGESVLEVGCGTGASMRWLARQTDRLNPITGVDINRYFLREATDMVRNDGLEDVVQFEEGDARALPFSDNNFDMTMAVTVLEEVDADAALAEMIRVTRPGGTVGVNVRAKDIPYFVNLPLDDVLKDRVQHPSVQGANATDDGCADAGLYRRFQASTLTDVKMFPFLAAFNEDFIIDIFESSVGHLLDRTEKTALQAACAQARADGTFVFSYPHHCAVGKKPIGVHPEC